MSVEAVQRKNGRQWRVRWRDEMGQAHSRVLGRKRDAEAFDAELKRRRRAGEVLVDLRGTTTLADFVRTWWDRYALPQLSARTRDSYVRTWDNHIGPYLGDSRLRDLTIDGCEAWLAALRSLEVGPAAIYRAAFVLQGVLARAVEWGEIDRNPMVHVRKQSPARVRSVRPIEDQALYGLLQHGGDVATVTAFMAYAGLRPQELRALRWEDVGSLILVDKAAESDGTVKGTKTGSMRTVMLRPELQAWVLAHGGVTGHVLPGLQSDTAWKNWRRDHWPANFPPYDLRHTFVSRLIAEGKTVVEVAAQAGHTASVCLNTYAHLFEESRVRVS